MQEFVIIFGPLNEAKHSPVFFFFCLGHFTTYFFLLTCHPENPVGLSLRYALLLTNFHCLLESAVNGCQSKPAHYEHVFFLFCFFNHEMLFFFKSWNAPMVVILIMLLTSSVLKKKTTFLNMFYS